MKILTGVLIFSGSWTNRPWKMVSTDESAEDLYPAVNDALRALNGRPATQEETPTSYRLRHDESSKMAVDYQPDQSALLTNRDGPSRLLNIGACLPRTLVALSGRKVVAEFDENGFAITADPDEEVFGVHFFGDGNICRIPEGAEHSICKMGTPECCIFLACGGSQGFTCEKHSSLGPLLLKRKFHGQIRASRVGSCEVVGREEREVA